jgi:nucleotide-binding universal stress UspA family protein
MEGIVVGVDESPRAEAALRWAVDHAASTHQPVTAVMAWGFIDQHHIETDAPFDPSYDAEYAAKVLDEIVDRACGPDAHVHRIPVNELPAQALVEAARGATLLVLGARSINPGRVLVRDSISRAVLRDAPCPVVIVRDSADRHLLPVVVGVDGSAPSRRALQWAVDHSQRFGRPLVALHAWYLPFSSTSSYQPAPAPRVLAHDEERFLHDELDQLELTGLTSPIECRSVAGKAADALIEASAMASLVVVGSRGRGAVSRAFLGSVSDRVSHHASAPVVVVP